MDMESEMSFNCIRFIIFLKICQIFSSLLAFISPFSFMLYVFVCVCWYTCMNCRQLKQNEKNPTYACMA